MCKSCSPLLQYLTLFTIFNYPDTLLVARTSTCKGEWLTSTNIIHTKSKVKSTAVKCFDSLYLSYFQFSFIRCSKISDERTRLFDSSKQTTTAEASDY